MIIVQANYQVWFSNIIPILKIFVVLLYYNK